MTAAQRKTQPDPLDVVKFLVLYTADQIGAIADQIGGGIEGDDSSEVACEWLDSLKDEVQAMLAPYFPMRLPNTLPPIGLDGHRDFTDHTVFIPLYGDGRIPYEDVEIREGVIGRTWNLPSGYPQKAPIDWTALYPAPLTLVPEAEQPLDEHDTDVPDDLDDVRILVTEDGEPLGIIHPGEIIDAGTELAFKMAANCGDPEALERIGREALIKAGPAGFGYIAASALRQLAEHVLDPCLIAGEAAGVNVRAGLTAFAEGRDPEAGEKL